MALSRRTLVGAAGMAALARPALLRAQGSAPIRVGEINSYSTQPDFTEPYRKGWQMALSRVNDLGGVEGRKLEIVSRDDGGMPETAVRLAAELVQDQKVDLLAGGYLSNVGLAISAYALQAKKLYVAGEPLTDALTWAKGNRYTYRIRPSTFMQSAMLVETAAALPAKTYVTVAPNYEYGQSACGGSSSCYRPGARTSASWASSGRRWAMSMPARSWARWPSRRRMPSSTPCSAPTCWPSSAQGNSRGLFENRTVVSMLTGEPEYLDLLGDETPPGWVVTGYPWSLSDEPGNKQFVLDYTQRYHEPPRMGAVVGSALVSAIVSGILKSGGTDTEKMADGFGDAAFNTPFGICRFRAIDHQSTLGTYVGRLTKQGGRGGMVDWRYIDGESVMPSDAEIRQLRPG